ncbi:bifunctional riboflavin kinase/FAD synthetase [Qingshengfaniella alkalisoli]|uniref:Riboflavin biosynthesis protein n=1 Tax=Qingshengfaniella alkalisoli TaxID=2599296 RepID=A0A5B8ISN4_9RHOB|nr:bifunctional riboflavin kinase/FAD synthetase [Qingshengfaniella alkalisoli]QDY68443.1 bifunctional riboflavin kinase/FAD synthetase [Qingshengfaniella alkalisoli]
MEIIRSFTPSPSVTDASVAIGNFDGVHLGHRVVLDLAKAHGRPWGALTFEPHPREFFAPGAPPFRLMNAEARHHRFDTLGADVLYELPFDSALASLTAAEFVRSVLVDGLALKHVVVGADFCFGKGRQGTVRDLQRLGAEHGLDVTTAELREIDGMDGPVSSTRIREALAQGRPRDAASMLGHWHRIEGEVLHGDKRGRGLGFPTANMSIDGLHPPRFGVYAVIADVLTGPHRGRHLGVASVGVRPMFGANAANLETHIFDFQGDLYGEHLSIALVEYLRPEQKFDSLDALSAQMRYDSRQAREILSKI